MGELYATESWLQILLVTGLIGGGAAILTGRAVAGSWRPYWQAVAAFVLLAWAVRFVHFALFDAELISPPISYLADLGWLLIVGSFAWRERRTGQMTQQYPWLYRRSGPLTWRELPPANAAT